jgi:uncharacterized protein involved in response to NO
MSAPIDWRREPFRLLFPLGIALGVLGMLPWLLFGTGVQHAWPGVSHALTMTQAFLVALAVGFLGTMLPRRSGCAPLSWLELGVITAALLALPVALQLGSLGGAQLAFLIALGTLGQFVVRGIRRVRRATPRPAPPSFVLLPIGVSLGTIGAGLILAWSLGAVGLEALALGRQLAQQGLMIGLLLALAPMLAPMLAHGEGRPDPGPRRLRIERLLHGLAGLAFAGSFVLELVSVRWGLLLRGAVCLVELVFVAGLLRPGTRKGLHRWFFRISLWCVPVGLLAAGLAPDHRIQLVHLTYIGGLSLVAMAISAHVSMLHTGATRLADGRPVLVALAGGLTLLAAAARLAVESHPEHIFLLLVVASAAWLGAALAWMAFLVPRMRVGSSS